MTSTRRAIGFRHSIWAAAALLTIGGLLSQPDKALAQCQWIPGTGTIYQTCGNVGIGTTTPASRLHVYEAPLNASFDKAGSYFYLESNNNTGATFNNTHSVISVEGSTSSGYGWAGQIGVKSVVGPYWGPITDARSFYAQGKTRLNYHSITNYSGFYVDTPTVVTNSSITNAYGLYVGLQKATNVFNGYGIYQAGASDINYFAGNVGIGTTAPTRRLSLDGTNIYASFNTAGTEKWVIGNENAVGDRFVLYNSSGAGYVLTALTSGNVGIGTTNPQAKLDVAGNAKVTGDLSVVGTGNITASGTISGGNVIARYQDVAEWVPASHAIPAGTVVVLDAEQSNHVLPSTRSYDTSVAGVISANPGVLLGEGGDGKVMVATTGRVRVKVDATNAPIRVGDLLVTSDKEGIAMRSLPLNLGGTPIHRPGTLIGKALEPLDKGTGEILVLLSLQ